jgi:transcriptional regulator with XRE-family HTH domain
MNIGEKIKRIRTAKVMTQSELVGGKITRNMLSRIENGAANPSIDTVYYIAERLKVSPGYLLADENDEMVFRKHSEIVGIKKAFMNEDYRICRDMCMTAESGDDDEIQMLLCECNLAIGIEEFNNGRLRESCEYLDQAIEGCSKTLYRTDYVLATAAVCFKFIRLLSVTLSSNVIDENEVNIYPAMTDELCRYLMMLERINGAEDIIESDILRIGKSDSPYVMHLLATRLIREGEYAKAREILLSVLNGEAAVPQPVLYFVFSDLETCCREVEDFKGAYEFSQDKLELMQRLLS